MRFRRRRSFKRGRRSMGRGRFRRRSFGRNRRAGRFGRVPLGLRM